MASKAIYKDTVKTLLCILAVALCFFAWQTWSSSKFSHPVQKIELERSCKTHMPAKLKKMYSAYATQSSAQVEPSYYKNYCSPNHNIFTMKLGSKADKVVRKAKSGNQLAQDEITQVVLSQNGMARQFKRANKKTGLQILGAHGKMLYFAQDGKMKYNIMPTLSQVK